jgi:hypothetical protein
MRKYDSNTINLAFKYFRYDKFTLQFKDFCARQNLY